MFDDFDDIDVALDDENCSLTDFGFPDPAEDTLPRTLDDRKVRAMMTSFFSKKSLWCGGPIPEHMICEELHVRIVKSIELIDAFDFLAEILQEHGMKIPHDKRNYLEYYYMVSSMCHQEGIPKQYVGGFLIVYLKLCEGYLRDFTMP